MVVKFLMILVTHRLCTSNVYIIDSKVCKGLLG